MDEIVKVIRIDNGEAINSVKDLRKYIKDLQDSLVGLDRNGEDWQKTAEELARSQGRLNDIMDATKGRTKVAADSVNGLRDRLRELTKQYDSLSKAQRDSDFGKNLKNNINSVTTELKGLEEGTGRFQRNVGNYTQSIRDALGSVGSLSPALSGLVAPIRSVDVALKGLAANPIGIVIAAIALAVMALVKAFKRNEEAMSSAKEGWSGIAAVINKVQRIFDGIVVSIVNIVKKFGELKGVQAALNVVNVALSASFARLERSLNLVGQGVETVVGWFQKLESSRVGQFVDRLYNSIVDSVEKIARQFANTKVGKWLGVDELLENIKRNKAELEGLAETNREIAQMELDAARQRRTLNEENARLEQQIAQLRADAENSEKYTLEERLEKARQVAALEQRRANNNVKMAKAEYEIIKKRNSLSSTGKEDLDAESQAYIAITRAETEYQTRIRENITKIRELSNQLKSATANNGIVLDEKEQKKDIERQKKYYNDLISLFDEFIEQEKIRKENFLKGFVFDDNSKLFVTDDELTKNFDNYRGSYDSYFWLMEENIKNKFDQLDVLFEESTKELKEDSDEYKVALDRYITDQTRLYEDLVDVRLEANRDLSIPTSEMLKREMELIDELPQALTIESQYYDKLIAENESRIDSLMNTLADIEMGINGFDGLNYVEKAYVEQYITSLMTELQQEIDVQKHKNKKVEETIFGDILKYFGVDGDSAIFKQSVKEFQWYGEQVRKISGSITASLGSIASAWQSNLEAKRRTLEEEGKLDERTNKMLGDQFEKSKSLQIAEAVINTIAGALGAFMGITKSTGGWGWAAAAAEAAAVTAAGYAQITQIKNTQNPFKASSSAGSSATVTPNLTTFVNDIQSKNTNTDELSNLRNAVDGISKRMTNQKVYILQSDIEKADNISKTVVKESTW